MQNQRYFAFNNFNMLLSKVEISQLFIKCFQIFIENSMYENIQYTIIYTHTHFLGQTRLLSCQIVGGWGEKKQNKQNRKI